MIRRVLLVTSLVLILDRVTKAAVYKNLFDIQALKVIPGIFHITLVLNKGAAFGILKDQRIFFISLSAVVISFIVVYIWKNRVKDNLLILALGLLLGGAIGNLIDRLMLGYVIDFLDFRVWPVFNIADSAITIGAAILALRVLLTK